MIYLFHSWPNRNFSYLFMILPLDFLRSIEYFSNLRGISYFNLCEVVMSSNFQIVNHRLTGFCFTPHCLRRSKEKAKSVGRLVNHSCLENYFMFRQKSRNCDCFKSVLKIFF